MSAFYALQAGCARAPVAARRRVGGGIGAPYSAGCDGAQGEGRLEVG